MVLLLADPHLEERHTFSVARKNRVISKDILLECPLALNPLCPNLPLKNLYLLPKPLTQPMRYEEDLAFIWNWGNGATRGIT